MHRWVPGVTPLSTLPEVLLYSVGYVVVVLGGREVMRFFPPVPARVLKWPFFVHNALLTLGSLLLLLLYLERVIPFWQNSSFHDTACNAAMYYRVELLHIINYYFKYYEFVDTFFLVLKKKRLMFLHVYHHMATAVLCYTQIVARTPIAWLVICINLAVHVVMYSYYGLASLGISSPWKRWITTGQIAQFVIDLIVCNYTLYHYYAPYFAPWLPGVRPCAGVPGYSFGAVLVLFSYLVLFMWFYQATYQQRKTKAA